MSTLVLHSYWRSSASYRVRIALQLKGLPYEYVPVHLVRNGGAQFQPGHVALNPQSRVPVLETGTGVITQSMAIMEWLEERYAQPPLLPAGAMARARVRALAQMLVADVQPLQNVAVTRYLRTTLQVDEAGVASWVREWIGRGLAAFEAQLAESPASGNYCVGTAPTLADACLIPQCYSSRRYGIDVDAYPRIARIERYCTALPTFQRAAPEQQPDAEA